MKILNKIQLIIIVAFVALGAYAFASPYFLKKSGVIVVSVSNLECQNVNAGDFITEVGGNQLAGAKDFSTLRFQPSQFVSLVVNSGPGGCKALQDGSLGIDVKDSGSAGVLFGVDLVGGIKYDINTTSVPPSQLQNVANTLNKRVSYLNLADVKIHNNTCIEIITNKNTNINQLFFPGIFEAAVQEQINMVGGVGTFSIGSNNYTMTTNESGLQINNRTYFANSSFYVNDIKTAVSNITNTSAILILTVFNNSDIIGEVPGYSQISFQSTTGTYSFQTAVSISPSAGTRFGEITQNIRTVVVSGQLNLDAVLVYSLDGSMLSRLGMPSTLKGQNTRTIVVMATESSQQSLLNKKNIVEAVLNGGSLQYPLSVSKQENIPATQKNDIVPSITVIIFAIVVVPLALGAKYKKFRHNSISILVGAAEIFSVVSIIAAVQMFYKVNIVFDASVLFGIVLLSINWALNVLSINLTTHAQRDLSLKIKYKKLFSLTGLSKIFMVIVAAVFAVYGYGGMVGVVLLGVFLDFVLFRPFYKKFVS